MKKYVLALGAFTLISIGFGTSCDSAASKEDNSVKEEMMEAQNEVTDEVWETYRDATQAQIDANKQRIADLRDAKHDANSKWTKEEYNTKIDELQDRNQKLREKLADYPMHRTDWEEFKADVNKELGSIGQSLEEL